MGERQRRLTLPKQRCMGVARWPVKIPLVFLNSVVPMMWMNYSNHEFECLLGKAALALWSDFRRDVTAHSEPPSGGFSLATYAAAPCLLMALFRPHAMSDLSPGCVPKQTSCQPLRIYRFTPWSHRFLERCSATIAPAHVAREAEQAAARWRAAPGSRPT
jgi:hypothetical protein